MSISTLRRRIKSGEVEYSFKDGKYLLRDNPLNKPKVLKPAESASATVAPPQPNNGGRDKMKEELELKDHGVADEPVLATASRLLNELKKAYSLILQEKEEQILLFKEELADLRTLVRVLEAENERLKKNSTLGLDWVE